MTAQRPPPCRGPLLCQTNPPPNPVCTRKPCLPNKILHRSGFVRETTALPNQNRNHRLAPHNSARQTGAMANARRSQGSPPSKHPPQLRSSRQTDAKARAGRSPDQAVPGQSQDAHQTKRCQSNRRTPTEANTSHNSAGRQVPGQTQDSRQTKQHQTKRRPVYKPKSPASMETGDFSCRDPELLVAVL